MENIDLHDLSSMGYRERKMAADLLLAWDNQGLPDDFYESKVQLGFNPNSGCVFLTNEDYDTCMMNGHKLESWYNCPYCGHEGFKEDMYHDPQHGECTEYMNQIGILEPATDQELAKA